MMIYFKRPLYQHLLQESLDRKLSMHQLILRSVISTYDFNCVHVLKSTLIDEFKKYSIDGDHVCVNCGLTFTNEERESLEKKRISSSEDERENEFMEKIINLVPTLERKALLSWRDRAEKLKHLQNAPRLLRLIEERLREVS